jgi:type IV pilus assembly protein PilQ
MRIWTKTAGLLFLAAASVYSSQAIVAAVEGGASAPVAVALETPAVAPSERFIAAPADGATDVKLLEETTDPFASAPTTAPADPNAVPSTQPTEGRSVSSSEVSVSDAGTVEIHVNDANLVEVLRMLSLQSQKNIVASKDVRGTITANLYDVTVREALDAILHANGYAYREKGNFIYVYTTKEIAEIEKSERQMRTEVFRVYYTPAINAKNMIMPVLSKAGGEVAVTTPAKAGIGSAPAGGGGDDHATNDMLVVTDFPENLEAVRKILAEVDRRPQQILLEATILRATLNEDNALGIDFNVVGGVDFNTDTISNGQLVGAGVTAGAGGGLASDGREHSVGTGNAFSSPIAGGLKVGYVTNSISMFLSALEQVTDTTILANPKVLALNKQQGEVFVGNEDGYYTTLTTETTTSQSVQSLKTGTRLIFRPYIGNDGYIRLEVHPEDSDGSVKANGLPSKSTTEVTSNVMVKDGHTLVIGGLFRESSISGRSQVPFLGNIPLAGMLFKNQRDRTVREEVIILLTPHIVKDDASYSQLSEEELKRGEDLRVGVRKGMMPWGRERLAEGWYEAAKKEMAKPNPDRHLARWHLDCATNLNPKFIEAIQLKEQISGRQVTAADSSTIRSFVRRSILSDVAPISTTVPTTAPAMRAEAPSTQPYDGTADATTQPADETADATTQPSESTDATVETPATQPVQETVGTSLEEVSVAPTTQPTQETNSAEASTSTLLEEDADSNKQGESAAVDQSSETAETDEAMSEETAVAPTTQEDQETTVTVTPLDEQPGTEEQSK